MHDQRNHQKQCGPACHKINKIIHKALILYTGRYLHAVSLSREEEIHSHKFRFRFPPAGRILHINLDAFRLSPGRLITDLVGFCAIIGNFDLPALRQLFRLFLSGKDHQLASRPQLLNGNRILFCKHAVHQNRRLVILPYPASRQRGQIPHVLYRHVLINPDVHKLLIIPVGIKSFLRGNGRIFFQSHTAAIRTFNSAHFLIVRIKGNLHLSESGRKPLRLQQCGVAYRLRPAAVADPVNARHFVRYKEIIRNLRIVGNFTRNRAGKSVGLLHLYHGAAAFYSKSVSGNSGHIFPAGHCTFCVTVFDMGQGMPRNTSHIIARRALNSAVILTAKHHAHLLQAADAAGIALLGCDISLIHILSEHASCEEGGVCPGIVKSRYIALQVEIILNGHRAGNTRHIQVSLHLAVIDTIGNRGINTFLRVLLRLVLVDIGVIHIQHAVHGVRIQPHNLAELIVDIGQIVIYHVSAGAHLIIQVTHVLGNVFQIGVQASRGGMVVLSQSRKNDIFLVIKGL